MENGIFKAYDIRGIYPDELDEERAYAIGKAIGRIAGAGKKIFVNNDNRVGSKRIKTRFVDGIIAGGAKCYDAGLGPIMVAAYASYKEKTIGVSITASHNPAKYTGIISFRNGVTIDPADILNALDDKKDDKSANGRRSKTDYERKYIEYISKGFNDLDLSIGVDSMGGATTYITKALFMQTGIDSIMIRDEVSEKFYGKTPEPTKDNAKKLMDLVKKDKLDFGVQYDADGDRALFVDEKGRAIDPSVIGMVLIKSNNFRHVGSTVACPSVFEDIAKVSYSKVGHRFMEEMIVKNKIEFGVEPSAHFYFPDYYPFSDGLLATLYVARALKDSGKTLSELTAQIPKIFYSMKTIKFKNEHEMRERMKLMKERMDRIGKLECIDGCKIRANNGYVLFRESNTEPSLRYYCDGKDEKSLKKNEVLAKKISRN